MQTTDPEYLLYLQKKIWSKCVFCGASNGMYNQPLEQHRPRCHFKGPANSFSMMVPNYFNMISEDDRSYLAFLKLGDELKAANKRISELQEEILDLQKVK
jgi:hypothetical protein